LHVLEVKTGVTGYPALLSHVLHHGRPRTSRGIDTLDAGPTTLVMHDVTAPLPLGTGRSLSTSIAAAEALQLIGGFSDPALLPASFDRFREDNGTFHGAYGVRIGNQLEDQLVKLQADPGTRQAVITLWNPALDNPDARRDIPCTVALNFWMDGRDLALTTFMRSQDAWLGAPYDWFQFVQLQWTAANVLGATPGIYRHITNSTHLYLSDVERAHTLVNAWYATGGPSEDPRAEQPHGIGRFGDSFADVRQRAHYLHLGADDSAFGLKYPTPSEEWYARHLVRRPDA
jgi:thymidylate synthase